LASEEIAEWRNLVKDALEERFDGLFEKLDPSLYKIAKSIVPDMNIDDVVQAAHIRIWKHLEEVDLSRPETIKAFLYRLALNAIRAESNRIAKGTLAEGSVKERLRLYYLRNKEEKKRKRRERYKANPKKERMQQKEYYYRRKDRMEQTSTSSNICRVYIAGPISLNLNDDEPEIKPIDRITHALKIAQQIRKYGYTPFVPHLYFYWDNVFPRSYEYWIKLDIEWLLVCDVLWRIDGSSRGANGEEEFARKIMKIPIVHSIAELKNQCPINYVGLEHSVLPTAESTFDFIKQEFDLK